MAAWSRYSCRIELDVVVNAVERKIVLAIVDAIHPEISRRRAACVGVPFPPLLFEGASVVTPAESCASEPPIAGDKRQIVYGLVR